jgi:hypothetical protein
MSYNLSVGLSGIFHSSLTTEVPHEFHFLPTGSACLAYVILAYFLYRSYFWSKIFEVPYCVVYPISVFSTFRCDWDQL